MTEVVSVADAGADTAIYAAALPLVIGNVHSAKKCISAMSGRA